MQVVMAPNEAMLIVRQPDQRAPHEWRLSEIESLAGIRGKKIRKLLLLLGRADGAPVFKPPRERYGFVHHLNRLPESFTNKSGAQDRVARDDRFPRRAKCRRVQLSIEQVMILV